MSLGKAIALGIAGLLVGVLIGYFSWGQRTQGLLNELAETKARLEKETQRSKEQERRIEAMLKQAEAPPTQLMRDIHFDFDKYTIRPGDAKPLAENANWMKSNPNHLILIEGHTDERGPNEYNLALGERRAKSAMNHLVSLSVEAGRISITSYGEQRPICTEKNENCWAKNRRVHFAVKPR